LTDFLLIGAGSVTLTDLNPQRREVSTSLRHLKLFESVARLRSVRRASAECHLSQPAVTQALAKLEEQIGVALLERHVSGTYLNEFGVIFQLRTQRLFAQIEQALVELGVPNGQTPLALIASRITRAQIRSLTAIEQNGSFARAARALGVSQISLQRAARDLERTLRTPLYVQTAFGIMATPAGAEFSRKLKLAMRELDSGLDELDAAKGKFGGEIVIGAMLLAGSVVLASILDEFARKYPNASIRVLSGNAEELLKYLHSGDIDLVIGLLRDPAPENLVNQPLAETPFIVAGRPGHPLMGCKNVSIDDLARYPWITGTPGASRRVQFERLFAGREGPPLARLATCSLPIIRLLLAKNDYLTLLTSYELLHEDHAVTAVPFGPIEPVPSIGLTTRENWLPTQLQKNLIDLVQMRIVGSLAPKKMLRRVS
jgi:LysR family transcriptional regulator of gallate degradation